MRIIDMSEKDMSHKPSSFFLEKRFTVCSCGRSLVATTLESACAVDGCDVISYEAPFTAGVPVCFEAYVFIMSFMCTLDFLLLMLIMPSITIMSISRYFSASM